MNKQTLWLIVLVAIGLLAPLVIYPVFLMKVLCFALFAAAFNLLLGYTGLLSFGHAAFFGMASYTCAHFVKTYGLAPELGVLAGTAVAGLLGLIVGILAIRSRGIYFAMVTLALAQMIYFFCLQAPFTGGEDGIQAVPRGHLFGLFDLTPSLHLYYFVLAVCALGFYAVYRIVHSPFGVVLKSIKDNEPRAISLGYNADHYKLAAFTFSATLAGLAGSTKALVFQLASLTDVNWHMSGEVVLMTLLGGLGTMAGPALGALLVTGIQNYLAQAGAWVTIIQGLIFFFCVLSFRAGIMGSFYQWRNRRAH